jgi:hypothetical protein
MISEENVKMGNKALMDEVEPLEGSDRAARLQQLVNSNLKRLGDQAMVLRDKVQENPKAAAGIALALAGSIWAISRSVSASRRRKRTITKLLAAVGLWRTLAPILRAARHKGPKLRKAGMKRLDRTSDLLKHNAGPFFERTLPLLVKRFSH